MTLQGDQLALKDKYEQLLITNQRQQAAIEALTEHKRKNWQGDANYMMVVKERILKAAQSRHVSYLQAFLAEKESK